MKSKEEISHRLTKMLENASKERRKKFLSRAPSNCVYNKKKRIHGNGMIGICESESQHGVFDHIYVCDTDEICGDCPQYKCRNTVDSIEDDFNNILGNPSLCGKEYPKISMLLWVLEGETMKPTFLNRIISTIRRMI